MENERLEDEKLENLEFVEVGNTKCKHYLVPAMSDPNSNMKSVECKNCKRHGASYDPLAYELLGGKLIKKEEA